jgi:hypothetical protein
MIKDTIKSFKAKERLLLLLLLLILFCVHKTGMVTMLALWCMMFIIMIPLKYCNGRLLISLVVFTFLYGSIGVFTGFMTVNKLVSLCLPLVLFYGFGKFIVSRLQHPICLLLLLAILLMSYQFEIFITFLNGLISEGFTINSSREFYLRGDYSRALSATLAGLNVSVSMVGLSAFFILKGNSKLRILYLLMFFIAISTTVYLLNRTGLVIAVLSTFVVLSYFYYNNRKALIIILMSVGLIFFFAYNGWGIDIDILMAYEERNFDIQTAGQRTMKWTEAFNLLMQHPFGWSENVLETQYYAHNMWLDIARVTGLMPFIALLVVTIKAAFIQLRLLKIHADPFVAVTTGLSACFFLSCFVEPVYGGLHLFLWVMLWGMQEQYYLNYRNNCLNIRP